MFQALIRIVTTVITTLIRHEPDAYDDYYYFKTSTEMGYWNVDHVTGRRHRQP